MVRQTIGVCVAIGLVAMVLPGCTYIKDESVLMEPAYAFITAVENNQPQTAWVLLSQEAKSKIAPRQLAAPAGDFEGILEAFRQAQIATRSKNEISAYVNNLKGAQAPVQFVLVQEAGAWKIANVMDYEPPGEAPADRLPD